jgi:hypothetical protein
MTHLRDSQLYDEAIGPPGPHQPVRHMRPTSQWDDPTWLRVEIDTDYMRAKGVAHTATDRAHNRQLAADRARKVLAIIDTARHHHDEEARACG